MQAEAGKPGDPGESGKAQKVEPKPPSGTDGQRRVWRVGIIALALIVGVIAWVATRGDDDESEPTAEVIAAHIVSVGELAEFADEAGHPVYWAGSQPGTRLELSQDSGGQVFLRYLRDGAPVDSEAATALTVGSYPLSDPTGALDRVSSAPGAIVRQSDDGRELVSSASSPTSVYFASPDNSVQVEVYDPVPKRAMSLAASGRVQPVG
jgi:hypothetical protein